MRRKAPSLRLCAFILCLAVLWVAAGAPLFANEWRSVPDRFVWLFRRMPVRMETVFQQWLPGQSIDRARVLARTVSTYI